MFRRVSLFGLCASVACVAIVLAAAPVAAASGDSSPVPVTCDTTGCTVELGGGYVLQASPTSNGTWVCEGYEVEPGSECGQTGVFISAPPQVNVAGVNSSELLASLESGCEVYALLYHGAPCLYGL